MQNESEQFYEQEFHGLLAIFATNSKVSLNQVMIRVYDKAVEPYGYENASKALTILMNEVKSWQMPTPKQITDKIEMKASPLEAANQIVGKIFESVSRFGYMQATETKEYVGTIGWEVIKQFGGWSHICQELGLSLDKASSRAQMRDLALSLLNKGSSAITSLEYEDKKQIPAFIKLLSSSKEVPK